MIANQIQDRLIHLLKMRIQLGKIKFLQSKAKIN
jgi:predicted phosphatase